MNGSPLEFGPPNIDNLDTLQAEEQCGGYWDDYTNSGYSWQSSNTAVARLPNSTLHTVAVGSATGDAEVQLQGSFPAPKCPKQVFEGQQGATVCPAPTTETTAVAGTVASIVTEFNQTISDVNGDSFDNKTVAEQGGGGSNTCYWNGNTIGLQQYPRVSGGVRTVAGNDVAGQHNHWGFDNLGFIGSGAPSYIRTYGPAHGVSIPCTESMPQTMVISCSANSNYNYKTDVITVTVNSTPTVTNCRAGVCQTISAP